MSGKRCVPSVDEVLARGRIAAQERQAREENQRRLQAAQERLSAARVTPATTPAPAPCVPRVPTKAEQLARINSAVGELLVVSRELHAAQVLALAEPPHLIVIRNLLRDAAAQLPN